MSGDTIKAVIKPQTNKGSAYATPVERPASLTPSQTPQTTQEPATQPTKGDTDKK